MFIDIAQNTDEWLELRSGKVTGSAVAKIMANDGKAFGEPAKKYAVELAVERLRHERIKGDRYSNAHMEAGHIEEPIARDLYTAKTGNVVTNGGFFDNGKSGASPDGCILFENGGIEIKSVTPYVHYKTIERNAVDPAYQHQITFNIRETGWDFIDYISFCEQFHEPKKLFIFRVHRSKIEEQLIKMDSRIEKFECLIDAIMENISKK